jgi:hypothetical protein
VPLEPVAVLPLAPAELPEPLPTGVPELELPELSPVDPLKPSSPLEEAVPLDEAAPLELAPEAAPLADDPVGSSAHAQTRLHAIARHAHRRMGRFNRWTILKS